MKYEFSFFLISCFVITTSAFVGCSDIEPSTELATREAAAVHVDQESGPADTVAGFGPVECSGEYVETAVLPVAVDSRRRDTERQELPLGPSTSQRDEHALFPAEERRHAPDPPDELLRAIVDAHQRGDGVEVRRLMELSAESELR
jgi:hypothetical protein